MKILYILKRELNETARTFLSVHRVNNDVTVIDINDKSAEEMLDLIETHDRLIMW
ncbi:MAG: hypothetical protein QMD01_07165 [Thermodesulfovibrionales bacterium]|nr:hypothetical protein [Thermodesulfovibrionales bacterium]